MSVFISYSSVDKEIAGQIHEVLEDGGFQVFIDRNDIEPGQDITERILDGMSDTKYVIVILSVHSVSSHWVPMEVGLAIATGKHIIPYKTINLSPGSIPTYLQGRLYVEDADTLLSFLEKNRVPLEGLRILRALVGEDHGRDLRVFRSPFYTPYFHELKKIGFIREEKGSYYLTEKGAEFTHGYLEDILKYKISPRKISDQEEFKERRILLDTLGEEQGRGLFKYRKNSFYSLALKRLTDRGYIEFDQNRYRIVSAGRERLKYYLT